MRQLYRIHYTWLSLQYNAFTFCSRIRLHNFYSNFNFYLSLLFLLYSISFCFDVAIFFPITDSDECDDDESGEVTFNTQTHAHTTQRNTHTNSATKFGSFSTTTSSMTGNSFRYFIFYTLQFVF